ncbi:MAG: restriction endonuclease subunit S [Gallionella sp.]|nr:restriction endonuclease subunit S [Gallionella sp.]
MRRNALCLLRPTRANGVPYIGIGEVDKNGNLNIAKAKKVSWDVYEDHSKRYQIREGSFMFGKIGTLGRPTFLPSGEKYVISANVILIQPNPEKVISKYLHVLFSSPKVLADIAGQANSTSQAAFGIKKMRAFPLLLPSKQEQTEIVRRVGSLFAYADRLEARYAAARTQVEKLTPATLAKAFRGELVPQDPNDEPASVLLERIRAQRDEQATAKPKRGRKLVV